jgi:adhesin transport system outer membrane protein
MGIAGMIDNQGVKMKFKYSVLFCAVAGAILASGSAVAQSLSEAVDQTIKTNPDVLIDANRRLSVDEAVNQAKGGYRPKIDLAAGIGREWSENTSTRPGSDWLTRRESSLTLTQMLYDGFGTKSEVERHTARVQSAAHKVAGTSEEIGLRAVETYLEVVRRQELRNLTADNLAAHERVFEQIKLRSDSGVGRKADLEQAQARLSLAQANMASAEANLREANIQYQRVVGEMPSGTDRPAQPEGVPVSEDDAVSSALVNHPLVRSAEADIEATKAQTRAAESLLRPRVDLELGTSWNDNLDGVDYKNNDAYAMLRFRYNLYRGGTDQARVAERRVQTVEATEVLNKTRRQVEESTRLSWNSLLTSGDRLPKLKAHAEATEQTRDAYAKQFNIGQRTLLDLLDSENELYTARSNHIDGQYVEIFARYRLLADMGMLLQSLGVDPREESKVVMAGGAAAEDNAAMEASVEQPVEASVAEPAEQVVEPAAAPEAQPAAQ